MSHSRSNTFEADFRAHFERTYGSSGASFEEFEAAYRYGRLKATEPGLSNESYPSAKESLRNDYALEKVGTRRYEEVEEAVRYAFEGTQALRPHQDRSLHNKPNEYLRGDGKPGNTLENAAAAMTVGRPENDDEGGGR